MFRVPTYLPLVAALALVTTWSAMRADPSAALVTGVDDGPLVLTQSLPPGHPPIDGTAPALPPGHPPIYQGEMNLPPGHPPVCPGRGRLPSQGDLPGRTAIPDPSRPPILST